MATRIKTFADVDTSSDFDVEDGPVSRSAASLTFRTEQTEGKSVGPTGQKAGRAVTESEGSIMFDSDSEDGVGVVAAPAPAAVPTKAASPLASLKFSMPTKAASPAADSAGAAQQPPPPRQKTEPPPVSATPAPAVATPPPAEAAGAATPLPPPPPAVSKADESVLSPQPKPPAQSTRPVSASKPADAPTKRRAPQPTNTHDGDEEDSDQDSFADAVLPRRQRESRAVTESGSRYQVRIPPVRQSVPPRGPGLAPPELPDDVNELLLRAQLRLEEKKRCGDATPRSTPRQRLPSPRVAGHSAVNTPFRAASTSRRSVAAGTGEGARRSVVATAGVGGVLTLPTPVAALQDDAKVRRLTQENARLVEEVNYLDRENQKLRAASGTADTAEAMRLQLTVDMLRKELQARELDHQREREDWHGKADASQEQIRQLVEQAESYASSAEQYQELYQEKLRELEDAKTRFQAVVDQVQTVEQRQRVLEQQHKDRLEAERDRAERAVANLQDVKQQRDHIQALNDQLQAEVQRGNEERRQLKASLETASSEARQLKEEADRQLQSVRDELDRLRQTLTDKEKRHAVQLREEQRQQSSLQQRIDALRVEHEDEIDRLRRSADVAREDTKRLLREERDRRLQAENDLRRAVSSVPLTGNGSVARETSDAYTSTMVTELERRLKECKAELDVERRGRADAEEQRLQFVDELEQVQQALQYYQQEVNSLGDRLAQSETMRDASDAQRALLQSALDDLVGQDEQQAHRIVELQLALEEAEMHGYRHVANTNSGGGGSAYDAEQLSAENERLTSECERLANERDQLLEDNGRIAEELLKWKDEMRQFARAYTRTTPSAGKRS